VNKETKTMTGNDEGSDKEKTTLKSSAIGDGALGEKTRHVVPMSKEHFDALKKGAKVRIRTSSDLSFDQRPKGQDTKVSLVLQDGTEMPLRDVYSLEVGVDSRSAHVKAVLVVHNPDIDMEAQAELAGEPGTVQYFQRLYVEERDRNIKLLKEIEDLENRKDMLVIDSEPREVK
jgi:hypothetical protein